MSGFRAAAGAAASALVAGVAMRVRQVARSEQRSVLDVVADLPNQLRRDAACLSRAAAASVADGRAARERAMIEFDEQVAANSRRTQEHDG